MNVHQLANTKIRASDPSCKKKVCTAKRDVRSSLPLPNMMITSCSSPYGMMRKSVTYESENRKVASTVLCSRSLHWELGNTTVLALQSRKKVKRLHSERKKNKNKSDRSCQIKPINRDSDGDSTVVKNENLGEEYSSPAINSITAIETTTTTTTPPNLLSHAPQLEVDSNSTPSSNIQYIPRDEDQDSRVRTSDQDFQSERPISATVQDPIEEWRMDSKTPPDCSLPCAVDPQTQISECTTTNRGRTQTNGSPSFPFRSGTRNIQDLRSSSVKLPRKEIAHVGKLSASSCYTLGAERAPSHIVHESSKEYIPGAMVETSGQFESSLGAAAALARIRSYKKKMAAARVEEVRNAEARLQKLRETAEILERKKQQDRHRRNEIYAVNRILAVLEKKKWAMFLQAFEAKATGGLMNAEQNGTSVQKNLLQLASGAV